jgi:hypothetical protein
MDDKMTPDPFISTMANPLRLEYSEESGFNIQAHHRELSGPPRRVLEFTLMPIRLGGSFRNWRCRDDLWGIVRVGLLYSNTR